MAPNSTVTIRQAELADATAIAAIYNEAIIYVGTLKEVGHKFGRLIDVHIFQKLL